MAKILSGKITQTSFIWLALVVYVAIRAYQKVMYDPSQASLLNDATGVFLNILLIGIALMGAVHWMRMFLRKKAGDWM